MAMMLKPPSGGAWLATDEVVVRLKKGFAKVEVAAGVGAEYGAALAASYRRQGQPAAAERVEAVKDQGTAVMVTEGEAVLVLLVFPGLPLMTGFRSEEQLQAVQPLLVRAAAALGYVLK